MKSAICLFTLSAAALLSGCASVNEAFSDVNRICRKPEQIEFLKESDWVLVGNLFGGFGSFEPENLENGFSNYENCSPGPKSLSNVDEFANAMAGWTLIEVRRFNVPLVASVHWNVTVLIPQNTLETDNFDIGSPWVWMGYGDLVAARWTSDHVFVVSEILCRKGEGYRGCTSDYERGLFDLADGFEHALNGKLKRDRVQIDTDTYKKIE